MIPKRTQIAIIVAVHVLIACLAWVCLPPWILAAFLCLHIAAIICFWALLPKWVKTKSKGSTGKMHFNIIGEMDGSEAHQSVWERICDLAGLLSDITSEEVITDRMPFLWPRMLVSYFIVVLHRNLLATRMTDHGKDNIILSAAKGKGVDPVSREALEGLMDRIKFAKWGYPFDKDYIHLEDCLQKEGFILLAHDQTPAPGRVAHYTAINKKEKILLLVPRGSSALSDIVTDAAGNPTEQTVQQVGMEDDRIQSIWSHEGCLMASNALEQETFSMVQRLVNHEGYKVEIVGHSLGAAVACVLGIFFLAKIPALRDPSRLRIYAFAPPPCLDESASKFLEPYVSTIVWNDDMIPTLSVPNYISTCKIVANMHQEEAKFHGWLSMPRAFMAAITTALGFKTPITLSEKRLDYMCEYAILHAKSVHRQVLAKNDPTHVHVPGKVIYLWERSHNSVDTGEINGVTAIGSKFLHLHVVLPTKRSFSDHMLGAYETGMQRLLDQMGDSHEHRKSIFLWESIVPSPELLEEGGKINKDD